MEQIKKKAEERNQRTGEDIKQMEETIKENKPEYQKRTSLKDELLEKVKQKEEAKRLEEEEPKARKGRKPYTEEQKQQSEEKKQQKKEDDKKMISRRAFETLLENSPLEEHKELRDAFDHGFLEDKRIKDKLKKLNFSKEMIAKLYKK